MLNDALLSDDFLSVNCGRCGKPLIRSVEDLRDERTSDCDECEKTLPMREPDYTVTSVTPLQ
jgi:hypothetical protein